MAHTVNLPKKSDSAPHWDEWLATKDISILSDYPECAGLTLEEVANAGVEEMLRVLTDAGMTSHEYVEGVGIVTEWISEAAHEASKAIRTNIQMVGPGVVVLNADGEEEVDADGNVMYYTPLGYLQHLYRLETQGA